MGPTLEIETWGPGAMNRPHRGFYGTAYYKVIVQHKMLVAWDVLKHPMHTCTGTIITIQIFIVILTFSV